MVFMHRRKGGTISIMLLISLGFLISNRFRSNRNLGKYFESKRILEANKLVDMSQIENHDRHAGINKSVQILFLNKPNHIDIEKAQEYIYNNCSFKKCILTTTVKNIAQMSAIVFNAQDDLQFEGQQLIKQRQSSQIWILYRAEPMGIVRTVWFRDDIWENTMNWTWGYRLDSDIFFPFQILVSRKTQPKRDYLSIYKRKTKMAAWVVSHCHAKSLRDEFTKALVQEGIQVDIYGRCSENKTRVHGNYIRTQISAHYKFYLSLENHFCKDYVSEKFFTYLTLDTILIVRGGLNYSKHFDANSFIDASSFSTVKSLARYILTVSNDAKLYTNYLKAKDKYLLKSTPAQSRFASLCRLCGRIINKEMHKKIYNNVANYLENGTCFNPKEIF